VSPIFSSIVTAAGGVLTGLALAGGLLWRQQQQLARARHAATHDETTGLPNRRALLTAIRRARHRRPFGIVLLDLDGFKAINDTFDHETGNDLLTAVGRRLAHLPPPVRLAARLSGDEFALLVAGNHDEIAAAAHAAWRAVGLDPFPLGDRHVPVLASVGFATATLGIDARTLLRQADAAMYHAKQIGSGVHGAASAAHTEPPPGTRCRDLRRRD
jgi:diguanylate cyclase